MKYIISNEIYDDDKQYDFDKSKLRGSFIKYGNKRIHFLDSLSLAIYSL